MHVYSSKRRSSSSEVFYKIRVLENFQKFTYSQENTCAGVSLNKVPAWRPATSLKQRPWHRCFSANFCKIFKSTYFKKELNASTYSIYLFLSRRFECTTLIIKELLLNLSHFIFTNIAIFIKP